MNEKQNLNQNTQSGGAPTYGLAVSAQTTPEKAGTKDGEERERRRQLVRDAARSVPVLVVLPLTFFLGVLLCELVVRHWVSGAGLTAVVLAAYAVYTFFVIKRDRKRLRQTLLLGIPTMLLALSFAFSSSISGRGWMVLLLITMAAVLNTVMSGSTRSSCIFSADTLIDTAYTHAAAPFINIVPAFGGLFERKSEEKAEGSGVAGSIGKVIIGLVISVPVVIILGVALVSADAVFEEWITKLIDHASKSSISFGRIVGDIFMGGLVCLFGIPLVIGLRSGYVRERKGGTLKRWIDPVIAATVVFSAGALYVMFVAVQISYFFPVSISYYFGNYDFTNRLTLPREMTWAEYARSGFFELSGIIIASFIAIALLMIFTRSNEKGKLPVYLKAALTVIAGCNIVMAVSAVMRMGLYTIWCGLTAKRIGVLMIIAVITLSLAAVIIKLWRGKFPVLKVVGTAVVCAAVLFGCMNVERICAEVNVARHIEQGTSIDMCYLGELSYAAAPAVERLMNESPNADIRLAARGLLARYCYLGHGPWNNRGNSLKSTELGEMTLDFVIARNICYADKNGDGEKEWWLKADQVRSYSIYADWQEEKSQYERWNDDEFESFEEFKAGTVWYEKYGTYDHWMDDSWHW